MKSYVASEKKSKALNIVDHVKYKLKQIYFVRRICFSEPRHSRLELNNRDDQHIVIQGDE